LALADRSDHPALLLARKTHAVQLNIRAFEFLGREDSRLGPTRAVAGDEDRIPGKEKAGFLIAEVNVVYTRLRADRLWHPRVAAVFGVTEEPAVAADPAALAVEKVDGVEIVASGVDFERHPTSLGSNNGE